MTYQVGDHAGFVDLMQGVALEAPLPKAWHLLQVFPNREFKVMKAFRQRNISAYLPTEVQSRNRSTGAPARRAHLGRTTTSPLFPGLIFIPDFQVARLMRPGLNVEGIEGFLYIGPCLATLQPDELDQVRAIEVLKNTPRGQRKYVLGQLVRLTEGPFAGFAGRIDRLDSRGRLTVLLDAVKRGIPVKTSEVQIEPVDPATHDRMVRRQGRQALERRA